MSKIISIAVRICVLLVSIYVFSASLAVAAQCRVQFSMLNRDRHVWWAPYNAECLGDDNHSQPFGNWGVASNVGDISDSTQFSGWGDNSTKPQWNSCRKDFPPPSFTYYNDVWTPNGYTEQHTIMGDNSHGGGYIYYGTSCARDQDGDGVADTGGCKVLGNSFSVTGNYMTLYELDPPFGGHDTIGTLYYFDFESKCPGTSFTEPTAIISCAPLQCTESIPDNWHDIVQWRMENNFNMPSCPWDPVTLRQVNGRLRLWFVEATYLEGANCDCPDCCKVRICM